MKTKATFKLVILSLMAAGLLVSCKNAQDNSFTVKGNFKNADKLNPVPDSTRKEVKTMLYLEEIVYGKDQAPIIRDSAVLQGSSGHFDLKAKGKSAGIYELLFTDVMGNSVPIPLINDASDISIDVDLAKKDEYYTVQGSAASTQLKELIDGYGKKTFAMERSFAALDSLKRAGVPDSLLISATNDKNRALQDLNDYLKKFIQSSSNPTLGILALGWGSQTFSKEDFESSLNGLRTKFPNNEVLEKMKKTYDAQLAQRAQMEAASGASDWVGKSLPDFSLPDTKGKEVSLASFRGKYVLVDFWASWCGPCRMENPNVVKAYQQFRNKNFTIVGVSLDKEKEPWLKAIQTDGLAWTQISDLKYWDSKAVSAFGFQGIPFNLLVDPQGKVIAQELRGNGLENKLKEVLGTPTP